MRRTMVLTLAALGSLSLLSAVGDAQTSAAPAGKSQTSLLGPAVSKWDDYKLIVDRNIFSRTRVGRVAISSGSGRNSDPQPPLPRVEYLILRGVSQQGGVREAFFEDSLTTLTVRVMEGDELKGGKVLSISPNSIEYVKNGVTVTVPVEEKVTTGNGGVSTTSYSVGNGSAPSPLPTAESQPSGITPPAASASPVAGAAAASMPSSTSNSGADDVVERMKKKRQQELKP